MRVSVPGLPSSLLSALPTTKLLPAEAVQRVAEFVSPGNVCVLTGAGVSVDSGIRAYRGADGRYANPNYKPIFYHELIDETAKGYAFRQRYWLRSYLGYPPVRDAQSNTTHFALAALQYSSLVPRLITQNVDGLHHKALVKFLGPARLQELILELHGTLHHVRCNKGHQFDRGQFQDWLSSSNPQWKTFADDVERTGQQPRTNPDGDVAVESLGISYDDFLVPECPRCLERGDHNRVIKPEVVFFGESISQHAKDRSFHDVEQCDRLLVVGTTLATYSAYRLLKHATQLSKPVLLVNVGPSRADGVTGVEKIDISSGLIMGDVVRAVLGHRAVVDPVVKEMLESGIVKPPPVDDDRAPRAAG